jgi:hypothetical protein
MLFQDYLEVRQESEDKKDPDLLDKWIAKVAPKSTTSQVWRNADSLRFMELLSACGNHFVQAEIFSIKWIKDNLHTHSGGVRAHNHLFRACIN